MRKALAPFIAALLIPSLTFAASPTRIGTPSSTHLQDAGTTISLSNCNVVSTGQNRALIVIVATDGAANPTSAAKYGGEGGTDMTLIYRSTQAQQTTFSMYYMAAPAASSSATVWANIDNTNRGRFMWCVEYQDMVQNSATVRDFSAMHDSGATTGNYTHTASTTLDSDIAITAVSTGTNSGTMTADGTSAYIGVQENNTNQNAAVVDDARTTAGSWTAGLDRSGTNSAYDLITVPLKYQAPTAAATFQLWPLSLF